MSKIYTFLLSLVISISAGNAMFSQDLNDIKINCYDEAIMNGGISFFNNEENSLGLQEENYNLDSELNIINNKSNIFGTEKNNPINSNFNCNKKINNNIADDKNEINTIKTEQTPANNFILKQESNKAPVNIKFYVNKNANNNNKKVKLYNNLLSNKRVRDENNINFNDNIFEIKDTIKKNNKSNGNNIIRISLDEEDDNIELLMQQQINDFCNNNPYDETQVTQIKKEINTFLNKDYSTKNNIKGKINGNICYNFQRLIYAIMTIENPNNNNEYNEDLKNTQRFTELRNSLIPIKHHVLKQHGIKPLSYPVLSKEKFENEMKPLVNILLNNPSRTKEYKDAHNEISKIILAYYRYLNEDCKDKSDRQLRTLSEVKNFMIECKDKYISMG